MSYNEGKDDKAVYDNKVMIKNYSLRSFFHKEFGGSLSLVFVLLVFRVANEKTYFLHYNIYIKHLYITLNLSFYQNVSISYAASFSIKTCLDKTSNIF